MLELLTTSFLILPTKFELGVTIMWFANGLIDLGVALLAVVALAEMAKVRRKSERGYSWLAAAGVFSVFAGGMDVISATVPYVGDLFLAEIFSLIGWLFAIIGTLFVGYETLLEK